MMSERPDADIQADSVGKTTCPQCGYVTDLTGAAPFSVVQCPRCDVKFTAPGRLGAFVLFKVLGKGEMGATYKALEKGLGRFVAIKVMRKTLGLDKQRVDDFFAEARAVASLEHPNAVRLYSVGQEKGQPYIVMELIKGQAMDKAFSPSEPLAEDRALEIALGVAKGLQAASEIGLVHGDVKPANIMLDEKGTPKLVDFGIAKFGGTRSGEDAVLGTPYYVPPEAVRKEPVDHRGDMYSLGATLYHALSGSPPFPGTSVADVLNARLAGPPPDLRDTRPFLHPKTVAVVARLLEADPDRRYATYKDLLDDLQEAYFQVTGLETPELQEVVRRPEIPLAEPVRSSPIWLAGAVAAAVIGLSLAVWAIWLRGDGRPGPAPQTQPARATPRVEAPVFLPPQRTVSAPMPIRITCPTPLAQIHYTTDGNEPTLRSPRYHQPIPVAPGTTLKARAFRAGLEPSGIVEARYGRDSAVLADVVHVRTAAQKAWQQASILNPSEGFGRRLEQCDSVHASAEEFYRQAAYGAAKEHYGKVLALCKALEQLERQRLSARAAGDEAASAREALEQAGEGANPQAAWHKAGEAARRAFEKGQFPEAQRHWQAARGQVNARLTDLATQARKDWEQALAKVDSAKLKAFNGGRWQHAERLIAAARRALKDKHPGEAIRGYKNAARLLPEAVEEAKWGRVDAEVGKHLDRARSRMKAGRYDKALAEVNAALAIRREHSQATELKWAIEAKMTLVLDLGGETRLGLRWVPAGKFLMGSPASEAGRSSKEKQHEVRITRPFYIGQCEVRRREFRVFHDEAKYWTEAERDKWALALHRGRWTKAPGVHWGNPGFHQDAEHPVTCVTWRDAVKFCQWMSAKTRRTVRLPTEAEWEYACRAGATTRFSFGEKEASLHVYGNYADKAAAKLVRSDRKHNDRHDRTARVHSYKPNAWGIHDMHGNVAEWCADYSAPYPAKPVKDPKGPEKGKGRVVRGGSWDTLPTACRSAARAGVREEYRAGNLGFRVVVEIR